MSGSFSSWFGEWFGTFFGAVTGGGEGPEPEPEPGVNVNDLSALVRAIDGSAGVDFHTFPWLGLADVRARLRSVQTYAELIAFRDAAIEAARAEAERRQETWDAAFDEAWAARRRPASARAEVIPAVHVRLGDVTVAGTCMGGATAGLSASLSVGDVYAIGSSEEAEALLVLGLILEDDDLFMIGILEAEE